MPLLRETPPEELSPYILQHRDNPVDWFQWTPDAFGSAQATDRPIFLSVGYSACHWCHVMAHESFENHAVADILNRNFVSIKVDREERPDVDSIYMEALVATTGSGGWPMSAFLTPDGKPFLCGTYFPPTARHGLPSFPDLLSAVADAWQTRRADVTAEAEATTSALRRESQTPAPGPTVRFRRLIDDDLTEAGTGQPTDQLTEQGADQFTERVITELARRFDPLHGGFSGAPKFPQPSLIDLCLAHHHVSGRQESLEMATTTLSTMATGGIYDHLGGGFARYSTDSTWTVPHFEKMLYDQAGLARAFLHAWQVTGAPKWLQVVEETVGYVLRDLSTPDGAFFSAEDADSEGQEGTFYLWEPDQVRAVLGELGDTAVEWYGLDGPPNFEGKWILRRPAGSDLERPANVESARRLLLEHRERRVRPARDFKVITEWNAMFCSVLAEAAGATARLDWAEAALTAGDFLYGNLRDESGRWMRTWYGNRACHLGVAADHAWVIDAFTRLAELSGKSLWLDRAGETARQLLELFAGDDGSLFMSGADAEPLVARPSDIHDGATPSASSVAAPALARLAALTGETSVASSAARLVAGVGNAAQLLPMGCPSWGVSARMLEGAMTEVVVAGDRGDLTRAVMAGFDPARVLAWGEPTDSPLWQGRTQDRAYVCHRSTCSAPLATVSELQRELDHRCHQDRRHYAASLAQPNMVGR